MAKRQIRDRGRTEKRQRTIRSNHSQRQSNRDDEEEVISKPESKDDVPVNTNESGDDGDMAYNALVTILKSEHKDGSKKRSKNAPETEDDEVAGANLGEESGGEDEEANEFSDEDEELDMSQDPYETHYNVSEEWTEQAVKEADGKWPLTKSKQPDYSILSNTPKLSQPLPQIDEPHKYLKQRVKLSLDYDLSGDELAKHMLNYQDITYAYKSYSNKHYRKVYTTHVVNHVLKTRERIMKDTYLIRSAREKNEEEPELRDQGFTKPKVLILLPTRQAAHECIEDLIKYSGAEQVANRKKYVEQFISKDTPADNKPADYIDAFKGRNNDYFTMGMKFDRRSAKLYSSFYASDIIIASPVGLVMILESEDEAKREYDFLSSLEMVIIDRANHVEMQSWDNVQTVMKYVNKIPKDFHNADFSRIRMWNINDQARFFRQTLVFGEFLTPAINNVVTTKSKNLAGKIKYKPFYTNETCIMNSVGLRIPQVFTRFPSDSPLDDPDARFKHFTNAVLPSIFKTTSYEDGILIFIPSYFDYLRVKAHMKEHTRISFVAIDEYASQSKVDRSRYQFNQGIAKVMLYTERQHHFRRFEINGVKSVFMYQLPSNPLFYKELLQMVAKSIFKERCELELAVVRMIYSKWDTPALERIVGTERAAVMVNGNESYEFR
ncbi:U3 small nucleolar RNA-associated protein 25 [Diutina catenulata]